MTLWCTEGFKYACQGIASTLSMVMHKERERERERESVCVCVLMTLDKLVMWQRGVWTHWFIIIKERCQQGYFELCFIFILLSLINAKGTIDNK
jgi:hypothetical protein